MVAPCWRAVPCGGLEVVNKSRNPGSSKPWMSTGCTSFRILWPAILFTHRFLPGMDGIDCRWMVPWPSVRWVTGATSHASSHSAWGPPWVHWPSLSSWTSRSRWARGELREVACGTANHVHGGVRSLAATHVYLPVISLSLLPQGGWVPPMQAGVAFLTRHCAYLCCQHCALLCLRLLCCRPSRRRRASPSSRWGGA
jgi:hypothetical protein